MDKLFYTPGKLAIVLGTAAFLVAMPVKFAFDGGSGLVALKSAHALAKNGSDDDDGDDDKGGSGGHGSDDDSGDDGDDSSGSGGTTGGAGGGSDVTKIEVSSSGMEVTYSDGSREEIGNGRYERKNSAGRTVEERQATQADIDRLLALR
ncbi:MAG: hypothetical protein H6897_15210 [Rhodobacteraceae bacterium]|uniref:hypothetical protein n=1 Tax=Albidovulum sp. TaxID=1872424 RepID=UPI001DA92015|nr:hypothetical protein [uncultured Defluviimonas sp.]MCB2125521.1 hypothetical protein [Paracoccaceae bacterium]MCC0071263.1 hypothetical protein [Paracoccaceae bacterium]